MTTPTRIIDVGTPSERERRTRQAIRTFLLAATPADPAIEHRPAISTADPFRVACIAELIAESS